MGGKKPKAPPKPDPATISSSVGELAKKQQDLRSRRRGGFYSGFKNIKSTQGSLGGGSLGGGSLGGKDQKTG